MNLLDVRYLFILTLFYGIANSAYSPIRLSLIPVLVSANQFSSAVAVTSAGFNLSRFLGPGIAGFIVTFYGLGFAYLINAITFIPVIISLLLLKIPKISKPLKSSEGYFQQLREGFNYTFNHKIIRSVIIIAGISSFFGRGLIELLPAFTVTIFNGGSAVLAELMAASGFGAVIASFLYMTGKLDFKLHPNPFVGDLLNFISPRTETKEIAILNILGEEVFKAITLNNQIQLPSLIRGIYIVKLKQGNYLGLSRFVVP